jgi:hypothetical protein
VGLMTEERNRLHLMGMTGIFPALKDPRQCSLVLGEVRLREGTGNVKVKLSLSLTN